MYRPCGRSCQTGVVPDHCTCGAQLPPDARFCHKCGKPQFEYPPVEENEPAPAPVVPPPLPSPPAASEINFRNRTAVRISFIVAVLAMLFFLLPGPLLFPVLRLLVGFFLAGFVATLWYERRTGQRLSMRSGARLGWITGIFSFAIFVAMATAAMIAFSSQGGLESLKKQMPAQDPNVEQVMKMLADPASAAMFIAFVLVFLFVVLTTLPMLGGVLGAKLSDKRV